MEDSQFSVLLNLYEEFIREIRKRAKKTNNGERDTRVWQKEEEREREKGGREKFACKISQVIGTICL